MLIPRSTGGKPLHGKLLYPEEMDDVTCPVGLVWCCGNPGTNFGAEHMDDAMPSAMARECRRAGLPFLRFDYSGVRGSGGVTHPDAPQPFHSAGSLEAIDAFRFMYYRGCSAVAVGGHSSGACTIMSVAAQGDNVAAIVLCGTAPLLARYMQPDVKAPPDGRQYGQKLYDVEALPEGVPKLFIVGAEDCRKLYKQRMLPLRYALDELVYYASEPKTLDFVAGCSHNFEGNEDEAAARVVEFIAATTQTTETDHAEQGSSLPPRHAGTLGAPREGANSRDSPAVGSPQPSGAGSPVLVS